MFLGVAKWPKLFYRSDKSGFQLNSNSRRLKSYRSRSRLRPRKNRLIRHYTLASSLFSQNNRIKLNKVKRPERTQTSKLTALMSMPSLRDRVRHLASHATKLRSKATPLQYVPNHNTDIARNAIALECRFNLTGRKAFKNRWKELSGVIFSLVHHAIISAIGATPR